MIPSHIDDEQVVHVVPQNDLRDHDCKRMECWCSPTLIDEIDGGYIVVHNSMDGREKFENNERKMS